MIGKVAAAVLGMMLGPPQEPPPMRSMVMTADPGTYSGLPEAALILKELVNPRNVSSQFLSCAAVTEGTLKGHEVTVVITGIGHDAAAACAVDVLRHYHNNVVEVLYLGTSGWSPRQGGFFNPETDNTCTQLPAADKLGAGLTGIGDVCISPHTFLYNCGFCNWEDQNKGECSAPTCNSHTKSEVFGQCEHAGHDLSVVNALQAAAMQVKFEERPEKLKAYLGMYWNATWNGITPGGPKHLPTDVPNILDGFQCAETASYNIWSGVPQDYQCRKYLAASINRNYGKAVTPEDVTCVSAMEGPGWMRQVLDTAQRTGRNIPVANLRGASNYDHPPLVRAADGSLQRNDAWVTNGGSTEEFTKMGYQYAIASVSNVVLKYFENKQL